ncbi:hypothetical protein H6G96_18740 [Nostoc sp. FACHB-892]|nr:hypothetical protein [Nostoc sp. FACHB-892]MBD2728296.1 hypothetical protein [Nostoc sp. FACHB-892]
MHTTIYGRSLETVVKVAIAIIQSPHLSVKGWNDCGNRNYLSGHDMTND